jgi:hypothetical protein
MVVKLLFGCSYEGTLTFHVGDGMVVYVNGAEVGRHNMPGGVIDSTTPATRTISKASDSADTTPLIIADSLIVNGYNLIAVEVNLAALSHGIVICLASQRCTPCRFIKTRLVRIIYDGMPSCRFRRTPLSRLQLR